MPSLHLEEQMAIEGYTLEDVKRITDLSQDKPAHVPPPASTGDESDSGSRQPFFFRLPRELRDEIYHLAFDYDEKTVKVRSLERLIEHIREKRRQLVINGWHPAFGGPPAPSTLTPDKVPACPLENMAVCKQFFDEAATSWLQNHTIKCSDELCSIESLLKSSAVRAHLTSLSFDARGTRPIQEVATAFKRLSNLRIFTFHVGDQCFDTVVFPEVIFDIGTLQQIRLEAKTSVLAVTELEKNKWKQNVAAFEVFLNNKLKERRAAKLVAD